MSHAVFSIVTEVIPGHQDALERLLEQIEADHARNGVIDFTSFPGLHFSSFTQFHLDQGPEPRSGTTTSETLLVFEHNVDGQWRAHLDALIEKAAPGLRTIYAHCK